ncbi:MAG: Formamidopyrimidine-DNA glycolase [Sediminibacterium sp.]|nr:Formamidopyrimidine-DNA glycolase [Sediminibacterium sp.]
MPEGPSIVILKEAVQQFKGKKILEVSGNTKVDLPVLKNQVIVDFKSWGKHFLVCFKTFTIRIHFMLFGTYRINERKETQPRLSFRFSNGELNFYTCSIQLIEGDINEAYDWSADVMNQKWSPVKAKQKMLANPDMMVCDALMDQQIFSGVGNIIKNEVLFRIKVHPASTVGELPPAKMKALLKEAVVYSFEFLEWKKAFVLKKHWLAYNRKACPRDQTPFTKKNMGRSNRKTFFCRTCQQLYV